MPSSPPPSYDQALLSPGPRDTSPSRNGIPLHARRSMEDELRPLPPGWVRTYDPQTDHQFFVDTTRDPPRSIWTHPYDDDEYLSSLPPSDRERVRHNSAHHARPSTPDMAMHDTTDEEREHPPADKGKRRLGRKLKDTLTGTTHEQRAQARAERERREREAYEQHQLFRNGMVQAARTGMPQFIGRDKNGVNVYLEPAGRGFPGVTAVRRLGPYLEEVEYRESVRPGPEGRYVRPAGDMYGMQGGYGLGRPGMVYARPGMMYARPRGYGYGGGMGMPLAMPLLGGLMLGGMAGSMY